MDVIQNMDFCVATSRKGLRGSGLEVGDKVLVVGTRPLPEKRNDPYLQRIYLLTMKLGEDNKVQVPNSSGEDNGHRVYLVDPRCLTRLGDKEQESLKKGLEERDGS